MSAAMTNSSKSDAVVQLEDWEAKGYGEEPCEGTSTGRPLCHESGTGKIEAAFCLFVPDCQPDRETDTG